ncbi:PIPO, partial [Scallion mosaic virus]|uniref:PIPO n=1 Tax=Scallion mosaic virus TaxID=157018 RepID=UPI000264F5C6
KLSADLTRWLVRVNTVWEIIRNVALVKIFNAYTKRVGSRRYNRFRRQIQRIDYFIFGKCTQRGGTGNPQSTQ